MGNIIQVKRLSVILFIVMAFSQCTLEKDNYSAKSVSFDEFIGKVVTYNQIMEDSIITTDSAIELVRVYNTINGYSLQSLEVCNQFYGKFTSEFVVKCVKQLQCELSIGMGYYCKDSDIFIGGGVFWKNSYYQIEGDYFDYLERDRIGIRE